MLDEDAPGEPDEFDPVERWGTPEEDLPNVPTTPAPETAEADVDPELLGLWWRSVALANVALGGVAIGLMVIGFRGMWVPGTAAVALGLLAGWRLYQHYRTFERRNEGTDGEGSEDGDGAPADGEDGDSVAGAADDPAPPSDETTQDDARGDAPPPDDATRDDATDEGRNA